MKKTSRHMEESRKSGTQMKAKHKKKNGKMKQQSAQNETKGLKEKRGMNDIKSQTCEVKGTEEEQEVDGNNEDLRKRIHKTKAAECKKEGDDASGNSGQHLNGRNGQRKEESECTPTSGFHDIEMPPKIMKRGRPERAELTVVGIPKTKKRKVEGPILLPYKKLKLFMFLFKYQT